MAKASKSAAPAVVDKKAIKKSKKDVAAAPAAAKEEKKSKKSKKAKTPTPPPSESESSESDSEDSSDDSSDEEEAKPAAAPAAAAKDSESSDDSSDSDSDSDEEEAKPAAAEKKVEAAEEESSDDSSDSDSDSDEEEKAEEVKEEPKVQNGKRKADDEEAAAPAAAKKPRADGDEEESLNVFVGQLSWNVDNDWLKSEFEDCGEVVSARVVFDRDTQKSRGFGYVEFADLESSAKAIEKNGAELDGRNIRVNYAVQRDPKQAVEKRAKAFGDKVSPPAETLFIGSLSFSINEDQIYEAFGEHGDVQSVRLVTDRETGAPKGFGYVQFGDVDQATAALKALNGVEIAGRPIRVDYAPPKNNDGPRGGFGGGRGGGRGGFGGDRGGRGGGRGGFGGRGGGRGGFGDRGGRGGGRGRGGPPRGGARTGGIVKAEGSKVTFD